MRDVELYRHLLGLEAPWYLVELAALGYVPIPLIVLGLAWLAAAAQLATLLAGRYAPYPSARERPPHGPLRSLVRMLLLLGLRRRGSESESESHALEA